jgi:hypothetical protein
MVGPKAHHVCLSPKDTIIIVSYKDASFGIHHISPVGCKGKLPHVTKMLLTERMSNLQSAVYDSDGRRRSVGTGSQSDVENRRMF